MVKSKNIVVTGAGGFIGSHLSRFFFEQGHKVLATDIKWDWYIDNYATNYITTDARNFDKCLMLTKKADEVYNLAANMGGIGFITRVKAEVMRDNVLINTNMLEASRINKVGRYFFSSSACIYPTYKQETPLILPLKESDAYPADPDNEYGWEKLFTERMCTAYTEDFGLETRVARFHNIFGPEGTWNGGREKAPAAICRKVAMAEDGGEIEIWGDGKQTRSFCYIDDCVRGIDALMHSDCRIPLNIGSNMLVTIDKLVDMVCEIAGKNLTKKYDLTKPQGVRGRNADLTLVKKIIGWEPQISLEEGLRRTYTWIKNQIEK